MSTYELRTLVELYRRDASKFHKRNATPWLVWSAGSEGGGVWRTGLVARVPAKREPKSAGPLLAAEVAKGAIPASAFAFGVTVGRIPQNDVVIDDQRVSRFHAWFQQNKQQQWTIVDAESANGTVVEGDALEPKKPHLLVDGALLELGGLEARFYLPDAFEKLLTEGS